MDNFYRGRAWIEGEILILGYTCPRHVPLPNRYRLTQTGLGLAYALDAERRDGTAGAANRE